MLFMASTAASAVASNDLYVDQSNPNCPGSGTDLDPFCTIQAALDASVDGDLILVAAGQYMENVIIEMRDVTVQATSGASQTSINAGTQGSALTFRNPNGSTPEVDGFTLTGGSGTNGRGGGVYIDGASPTLRDCIIINNHTTGRGGGIHARNLSDLTMIGCEVGGNSSQIDGGGLFQSGGELSVTSSSFTYNSALDNGGGIYLRNSVSATVKGAHIAWNLCELQDGAGFYTEESDLQIFKSIFQRNFSWRNGSGLALTNNTTGTISSSLIIGNRAFRDGGALFMSASQIDLIGTNLIQNSCGNNGGGISAINNSNLTVSDALLRRNHSKGCHGGAAYLDSVNNAHFDNCLFLINRARYDGGAIYAENCSDSSFTRSVFGYNSANNGRGGAIHLISSSPTLDHCTLSRNTGDIEDCAIYGRNLSMPTITNSILWGDRGEELILVIGNKVSGTGSHLTHISHSIVEGISPENNNFDADPLFWNAQGNNYHLRANSPAIGQADDGSDVGAFQFGS
jgi:predicted outer membrane repeat protein